MSETAAKLLDQLLALPEADRLMVVDRLWESLGETAKDEAVAEAMSDPEFRAELERRLDLVENHPEQLLDGQEVLRELRERYRKDPTE